MFLKETERLLTGGKSAHTRPHELIAEFLRRLSVEFMNFSKGFF
jgi:hypothetical protein